MATAFSPQPKGESRLMRRYKKRAAEQRVFPKPKETKRIRTMKDEDKTIDRRESAKVRVRSGGQCEVWEHAGQVGARCQRRAVHVMHLIGGRGKRGRGISALAEHKLHGCATCHRAIDGDIGGKTLKRIGGVIPRWTDTYRREVAVHQLEKD